MIGDPPKPVDGVSPTLVPSVQQTLADSSADEPAPVLDILANIGRARVGRYRTLEKLGEGGMGVVVAAHDDQLDRKVALKFLTKASADSVARDRLVREARSLAKLSHPNIVAVYETGEADGMPYLAMELVEGCTLRRWIDGDEEHPPPGRIPILQMFLEIGRGLAAAHELGIVHRDFKPDNVLIGADGRPRVVDFGLASMGKNTAVGRAAIDDALRNAASPSLTATGSIMGTPAYMAPEQWYGQPADARSDQFAFCVALFAALYGRAPFAGDTMPELMASVVEDDPITIPSAERVPDPLHQALLRGLARESDARWPSLHVLLARIEAALEQVQPGLFTSAPTPVLALAVPILFLLPLTLLGLELSGVIPYAATNWVWLSTVQVTAMAGGAFTLRRRLVEFLGDRRMLSGPWFMVGLILGHRLIATLTHSSFEAMFAYDFLILAALIFLVVQLADRRLWPALGWPLLLLTLALAQPDWAPRLWAGFTIGTPPIVALCLLRTRDRLRGDGSTTSSKLGRSSRSGSGQRAGRSQRTSSS